MKGDASMMNRRSARVGGFLCILMSLRRDGSRAFPYAFGRAIVAADAISRQGRGDRFPLEVNPCQENAY
jgi:hypothetical protein